MAIEYVTGTQNTTILPTNKQDLANKIETALLAAGWTTVSGSGTTNLLMQSAATPQGYAIRVRMKDNSGTCLTFSLESTDGALAGGNSTTAGGAYINPGASSITFRIVANKYQAFIWTFPSSVARGFAAFGVPLVPSFLTGVTTRIGWMQGNVATDADTTVRGGLRTVLQSCKTNNSTGYSASQCMYNSSLWSINTTGAFQQVGSIAIPSMLTVYAPSSENVSVLIYRWQDSSAFLIDPLIGWGDTAVNVEAKIKGQLWGAVISTDAYTGDTTSTFDSHDWIAFTDNNTGGAPGVTRGTLLLATT